MAERDSQRGMYEVRDASLAQRVTLAAATALWVALVWWMLFGGGLEMAGGWFGRAWPLAYPLRRLLIAAALSIYFVRLLFTYFLFLSRGIRWQEVTGIVIWLLCIYLAAAILGGTNTDPIGIPVCGGVLLFGVGSWLNSYAEYRRHVWKQHTENRGKLYTFGLFRYSRHPNYLGDVVAYIGLCLITGSWATMLVPLVTLAGFVFVNIPTLDAHLRLRYGPLFDEYARRSAKLIPFVY